MRRYLLFPIGLLSLVLFAELGFFARTGPMPIDTSVALWFKSHRTPGEVQWASVISAATTPAIVFLVMGILLLYMNYWTRSWYLRDFIPLAIIGTCAVIATLAKPYFHRVRPGPGLTTIFDFEPSYPSSHTVFTAAAVCCLLFVVSKRQIWILALAFLATFLMGVVRLTLGVHWITDIFGSGFLVFGIVILFYVLDDWLAERESRRE